MKNSFILFFLFSVAVCQAQTATEEKVSVQPPLIKASTDKKDFLKIIFDDSNSQLISIDTNGKVVENVIIAFQLFVTIKGVQHSEQALGSFLNKPMRDLLAQAESNTVLYFENIQVKNAAGNLVVADDFQYTLSYLPQLKK